MEKIASQGTIEQALSVDSKKPKPSIFDLAKKYEGQKQ
jgi:hypothetical protein